ncbi:hypothetical protein ACFVT8_17165 [Lysinibacillus sp. NPDC058147]
MQGVIIICTLLCVLYITIVIKYKYFYFLESNIFGSESEAAATNVLCAKVERQLQMFYVAKVKRQLQMSSPLLCSEMNASIS